MADGVVVASTDPAHKIGDRVETGERLIVADGAELRILDIAGGVHEFEGPGGVFETAPAKPAPEPPARFAFASAVTESVAGSGERMQLGAVRGDDCDEVADGAQTPIGASCARDDGDGDIGFTVRVLARDGVVASGRPLRARFEADADLHAVCHVIDEHGARRPADALMGPEGLAAPAGKVVIAPRRGGSGSAHEPGRYTLTCHAMQASAAHALRRALGPGRAGEDVARAYAAFAELQTAAVARAQFTIADQ